MLNNDRQKLENLFFDFIKQNEISVKSPLSFLPPQGDNSLYFTNATVVNFKEDFLGGTPKHLATKQKCLRLHSTSKMLDDDYKVEWLSLFNMVGTIIPPKELKNAKSNLINLMSNVYDIPKNKLVFMVDAKDANLIKDIPTEMLILNSHNQKYYDWQFGCNNVKGKGLTFGVKQSDNTIIDVGNLIEITDNTHILGYECAYGLECLLWAKENKKSVFETYPIFSHFNPDDTNIVKIIDSLMSIAAIESIGIEPTNKTNRGQILKKLYRNLVYLSEKSNFSDLQIINTLDILSKTEFDDAINSKNILDHFNQSKTLVNCQRNAFLIHKEKLCDLYHDGIITIQEAEQKMFNWAEGKYYIDRHERVKYFDLGIDKKTKTDHVIVQNNCKER